MSVPTLPDGWSLDDVVELVKRDDFLGLCLNCGAEAHNVEPDAEKYTCEECDAPEVYGAEQVLIMLA